MTTYVLYTNGVIEADGIPLTHDELSPDYVAFLDWLKAGNTPTQKPAIDYLAKQENNRLDRGQFRAEFIATSPTNAQIVAAVKFLAKTQRLILKLLARMI